MRHIGRREWKIEVIDAIQAILTREPAIGHPDSL